MLLKQGLDFLGGVETLIPKDAKILLKPNLLKKAEVEKAVITHPVVVGAFAGILRESGYENIVLADSCGHGTTQAVIRGTGMDTYLEKYHIPAVDYSEGVKTAYPQGVQAKEFILPKELLEQDCVISLSKMKTHALERITGAVKNSYGFIYGFHKAKGHTQYPSADSFARMLIDLNKCVAPKLYVMDGIVAMEGNGPGSGDPVPMNVLLMSTDPVALDSVFSRLVYLKPEMVPTNYHGEKMGLGTWKEEEITLLTPDGEISMAEAVKKIRKSGFADPVSVNVETFGTEQGVTRSQIAAAVRKVFDLRPAAIIDELDLKRPIYLKTAAYGHFGRTDVEFPWEKTDKVEELKAAIGAQ